MKNPVSPQPDYDGIDKLDVNRRLCVYCVHFNFVYITTEQLELLKDQDMMISICTKDTFNS